MYVAVDRWEGKVFNHWSFCWASAEVLAAPETRYLHPPGLEPSAVPAGQASGPVLLMLCGGVVTLQVEAWRIVLAPCRQRNTSKGTCSDWIRDSFLLSWKQKKIFIYLQIIQNETFFSWENHYSHLLFMALFQNKVKEDEIRTKWAKAFCCPPLFLHEGRFNIPPNVSIKTEFHHSVHTISSDRGKTKLITFDKSISSYGVIIILTNLIWWSNILPLTSCCVMSVENSASSCKRPNKHVL